MQEEQKEPNLHPEEKGSDAPPEMEQSQTLFIQEESLNAEGLRNRHTDKPVDTPQYCIICNKQIEKYGRRKEDLKKSGWVFCPKHGWIQDGINREERVSEDPVKLSTDEARDDWNKRENSLKQEESKMLQKTDQSTKLLMQEEGPQEAESLNKVEQQITDLPKNVTRNRLPFIVVPLVIFFIVIASLLLGHFVWKCSARKTLETQSLQATSHKEHSTIIQSRSKVPDPSQGPVLPEKSAHDVTDGTSSPHKVDISASRQPDFEDKSIKNTIQTQKPLSPTYTVQVGVFSNIVYARSLQNRLNKKGYHCYISTQNSDKESRLYKVWIGKFSDRKKAASLSEKITRTEHIPTFVTLSSDNV